MRKLIGISNGNSKVIEQYGIYKNVNYLITESYNLLEYNVLIVIQEEHKQLKVVKTFEFEDYNLALIKALELTRADIEFKIKLHSR